MITLEIKNNDIGGMLLCYQKAGKSKINLLTVNEIGLPKIANTNSRQSYMAIDNLRETMLNNNVDIEYKIEDNTSVDIDSLNTIFKFLNKDIVEVSVLDNNLNFIYK